MGLPHHTLRTLLLHTPLMAMLPQLTTATMLTMAFTSVMPKPSQSLMLRPSQRLMLTMVVSMATQDMALALTDTPPTLPLHTPRTPLHHTPHAAMLPQLTMATMFTMAFTSVMPKPSQSLMPTMVVS